MSIELRPPGVTVETRSQPRLLLTNHYVQFSKRWPDQLKWVKGKTMQVVGQQQVTYAISRRIKEACYIDINLSNSSEQVYPDAEAHLYEVLIGLKPGSWYLIPYFPANQPIYTLDYPGMTPLVTSATLKHLGVVRPEDSPFLSDNPNGWALATFKLYLVYEMKPIILRMVAADGVDYELCTMELLVNRCVLAEKSAERPLPTNVTPKLIPYLDEVKDLKGGA